MNPQELLGEYLVGCDVVDAVDVSKTLVAIALAVCDKAEALGQFANKVLRAAAVAGDQSYPRAFFNLRRFTALDLNHFAFAHVEFLAAWTRAL